MKIIALGSGTSQGVPVIGCHCPSCISEDEGDVRLRSSIYVSTEHTSILIDIGPDFRTQFLANKIAKVDSVLITHEHNDHIIGLDDIRAINFTQNVTIPIYAEPRVATDLESRFKYAFQNPRPTVPRITMHRIDNSPFALGDITVTPIRIMHDKLPILGYRLNDMAYITDASYIDEQELAKLTGLKVLIINALRKTKHPAHFNLEEALEHVSLINAEKNYLTHISHSMGPTRTWSHQLPTNVAPLSDRMIIDL